jgi:hypothetical protein
MIHNNVENTAQPETLETRLPAYAEQLDALLDGGVLPLKLDKVIAAEGSDLQGYTVTMAFTGNGSISRRSKEGQETEYSISQWTSGPRDGETYTVEFSRDKMLEKTGTVFQSYSDSELPDEFATKVIEAQLNRGEKIVADAQSRPKAKKLGSRVLHGLQTK